MDGQMIAQVLGGAVVGGIPIVVVVLGLVEFSKQLGARGKALLLLSMALGILFGVGYEVAQTGVPTDFGGWFAYGIFGLAMGLVASGIYELIDSRAPKFPKPEG